MKKTFVTIFPKAENVHLLKDVGLIPYIFSKNLGYDSTLVCINHGDYPYQVKFTKSLKLKFINGDPLKVSEDARYEYRLIKDYIKKNAKNIDVLNIYHYTIPHVLLLAYYKRLNKKGIAYLKMDFYFTPSEEKYNVIQKQIKKLKAFFRNMLTKKIDVITCESKYSSEEFSRYFQRKIYYIPNGFFDYHGKTDNISQYKKNQFLTVGRIGSHHKNSESLLRAFAMIYKLCDWKLVLVGPIEKSFISFMEEEFEKHKGLKERVELKGVIDEKAQLDHIYRDSKVFVMPSRRESFGLVVAEAESKGDFLILTDMVAPWKEFTDNGRLGYIVPIEDDDALAAAMLRATKEDHNYEEQMNYAYENFSWDRICERIDLLIKREAGDSTIE